MNHYGDFVNLNTREIEKDLDKAAINFLEFHGQERESKIFAYNCCWKHIESEPCEKFHHYSGAYGEED